MAMNGIKWEQRYYKFKNLAKLAAFSMAALLCGMFALLFLVTISGIVVSKILWDMAKSIRWYAEEYYPDIDEVFGDDNGKELAELLLGAWQSAPLRFDGMIDRFAESYGLALVGIKHRLISRFDDPETEFRESVAETVIDMFNSLTAKETILDTVAKVRVGWGELAQDEDEGYDLVDIGDIFNDKDKSEEEQEDEPSPAA